MEKSIHRRRDDGEPGASSDTLEVVPCCAISAGSGVTMHRFEVWAPLPNKLTLQVNNAVLPMREPDELGWWHLDVAEAGPSTDYSYLIDDDDKRYPDPRS